MKTYIITRFSILDEAAGGWRLTRDKKNVKNILFSEERLSEKFNAFEKLTYKSIINQTNDNYEWMIFTSSYLPIKYKERLYKLSNDKIKIIEVKDMKELNKYLSEYNFGDEYSTSRLDDDDALNINFIERLNEFYEKSKTKQEIYSIIHGQKVIIINDQIHVENNILNMKKIAIGLTKFNGNIHSCGNHTKVDEKYDMIYDNIKNGYLLYSSPNVCDSGRHINIKNTYIIDDIINLLS